MARPRSTRWNDGGRLGSLVLAMAVVCGAEGASDGGGGAFAGATASNAGDICEKLMARPDSAE